MPSADMQAYLADKYMSGPKADAILARAAPKKLKKKRKADLSHSTATDSAMVVDDDGGWGNARASDRDIQDVAAEDLSEAVVASDRGFKKRRTEESGWSTIRSGMREESPPPAADEQPVIVQDQKITKGGLVTSAALKASIAAATANIPQRSELELAEEAAAQETVYRDTSGRKIDTKAARVDAARKKREREEKEAQKMEWGKGLVQREEQAKLKRELELLRTQAFSRRADDKDLNENLKAQERWNDPAAKFLSTTKAKGPRKPQYSGPTPAPNRFNIKPGYRWDGVDRGNGFEKKWFQRGNERNRNKLESYQWGAEDM